MEDRIYLPDGSWLGYHSEGRGPCQLVFLHGFAANSGSWHDLTPLFAKDRYTLHLLDLPAHGAASRNPRHDYSIPAQAERIALFLETRAIQQATLIGHSMGGTIALAVAINLLERTARQVARLALLDAPAYPQPLPRFIQLAAMPLLGPLTLHLLAPTTIARHGLQAVFADQTLISAARIERYAATFRVPGTARALSRCARHLVPPNAAQLASTYQHLPQPTVLIWGEQDRIIHPAQGRQLAQDLATATLQSVPCCGHNPHEENPHQCIKIIENFFKDNPFDNQQSP